MYFYEFKGRKPSANQVYKMVMHAAKSGHEKIEIMWGENAIELWYEHNTWFGFGWIKDISGNDMAESVEITLREFA
jgi:hypothetical protein